MHALTQAVLIADLQTGLNQPGLRPIWRPEAHRGAALLPGLLKDVVEMLHVL